MSSHRRTFPVVRKLWKWVSTFPFTNHTFYIRNSYKPSRADQEPTRPALMNYVSALSSFPAIFLMQWQFRKFTNRCRSRRRLLRGLWPLRTRRCPFQTPLQDALFSSLFSNFKGSNGSFPPTTATGISRFRPPDEMGCKRCDTQKPKYRKGLWSPEEDMRLRSYVLKHGHGCWSTVPAKAGEYTPPRWNFWLSPTQPALIREMYIGF